jgi:hypothetical protein
MEEALSVCGRPSWAEKGLEVSSVAGPTVRSLGLGPGQQTLNLGPPALRLEARSIGMGSLHLEVGQTCRFQVIK